MKARVVHVSTVHAPYDTRIFTMEATALARHGVDVTMAITVGRPDEVSGVRVVPLGEFGGNRFRRLPRNVRALRTMLDGYDLVHIHDPELLIAAGIARAFGKRVIYDVHEFFYEKFKTDADITAAWIPSWLQPLVGGSYNFMERAARVAGVVVVSEAMIPHYRRFVDEDRIALVRNYPAIGADDIALARSQPRPIAEPYVLHTGGVSKDRGFDVMIDAAQALRQAGVTAPIVNLGPIYLGNYTAAEQQDLLRRAEAFDVRCLGLASYAESLRWIAHASVGYLPMVLSENNALGQPRKMFEYFAFGLPVVGCDFGRVKIIVESHDAGLLVDPDDARSHAAALARLLGDEPTRARYAANALRAGAGYSFEAELPKLISLYERVLGPIETR